MQAQAYEGYYENGSFFTADRIIRIPEKKRIVITIFDEPLKQTKEKTTAKAWREFFEAVNASDEEIPESFERVNFKNEVSL